jgi:hypothetical protein
MGRVLQVSSSGYYSWCRHIPSLHHKENEELIEEIKKVHKQSYQTGPDADNVCWSMVVQEFM